MPNRTLREGILDSPVVNSLSEEAELFYRRLMSVVDDHGRFEANPTLLRAKLFAYRLADWTEERISRVLTECSLAHADDGVPLLTLYHTPRRSLLQVNNFGQRARYPSKYEPPPVADFSPPKSGEVRLARANGKTEERKNEETEERGNEGECEGEKPKLVPPDCRPDNGFAKSFTGGADEIAAKMYAAHPKKKHKPLVEHEIVKLMGRVEDLREIVFIHALWCRTVGWTEHNARYCPPLDEWLADEGYENYPDEFEEEFRKYRREYGQQKHVAGAGRN